MWQYGKREYGNLVFNQLTVELTTASSYLGQGAVLILCQYGRREYSNLGFNQLTVEPTTASSYLGQG